MKLTVFLILLGLLRVSAITSAQTMTVNLNCKNTILAQVLESLKQQTKLDFFYSNQELNVNKTIDIVAQEEALESVLKRILGKDSNLRQHGCYTSRTR